MAEELTQTQTQTQLQGPEERRLAQQRSLERISPPTEVPGYEIEQFLGAGAYGEVWVALDRNTNRRVAIKFYAHRGGLDWSLLNQEVEKLAFLSADRYVVQLIEVGWDAEPPFYVMEYLEHGSLEDHIKEGTLPVADAVALFREVAIGLVHAHGKGVLHCDLKPANILLDSDARPRLADFGQSRLSHEQTPALGTLFYMAPEQADLKAAPDARWDVYALGAVLYRMLVGEPPYRTRELVEQLQQAPTLDERLRLYRQCLRKASLPTTHRQVPNVDSSLAEILDRCLAANPSKRFPNPQAVVEALQLRAKRRERRPLLILGALMPAFLLLVGAIFAFNGINTAVRHSSTELIQRSLESDHFAARFVAETVARDIDRRWRVLEQERIEIRDLLQRALARIAQHRRQGNQPALSERWDRLSDPSAFPEIAELQRWIERRHHGHSSTTPAKSWFLTDALGWQLARSPQSQTIGANWSHRDYFHGQGCEFPQGRSGLKPVTHPHRSLVFTSQATFAPMVAFSVPIWDKPENDPTRQVIGLLAMTVELGEFGELRSGDLTGEVAALAGTSGAGTSGAGTSGAGTSGAGTSEAGTSAAGAHLDGTHLDGAHFDGDGGPEVNTPEMAQPGTAESVTDRSAGSRFEADRQFAVLIDMRSEGLILQHPYLAQLQAAPGREKLPQARLEPKYREQVARLQAGSGQPVHQRYQDPLSDYDPAYGGQWLAGFSPVVIQGRPAEVGDIGWVALVQEPRDRSTAPIVHLQSRLVEQGLLALGIIVVVLTALWGLAIHILNDSSRGLFALLRRRMGLSDSLNQSSNSHSPRSGLGGGSGPRPADPIRRSVPDNSEGSEDDPFSGAMTATATLG